MLPGVGGGEVPALLPSMLGSAFRKEDRYSSSSSASSTAWSLDTDSGEDQEDPFVGANSDPDTADSLYDEPTKATPFGRPLAYARRPSGTNTRSTVPHLHSRTSSGPYVGHVRGTQSVPQPQEDDQVSFQDETYSDHVIPQSAPDRPVHSFAYAKDSTITKSKRSRNRASLPSYFSLLQIGGGQPDSSKKGSPTVSTSSGQTIVRPSPPTPKLSLSGVTSSLPQYQHRGRRRVSNSSSISSTSSTRSKSDSHALDYGMTRSPPMDSRPRLNSRGTTEPFLDRDPRRGRAAVRRNSSPPPKMSISDKFSFSQGSAEADRRGRARVDELDGVGCTEGAPGYGNGRSGLLHRERSHWAAGRIR